MVEFREGGAKSQRARSERLPDFPLSNAGHSRQANEMYLMDTHRLRRRRRRRSHKAL